MNNNRKVEHNARIASRRFSKGIVCKIIQGQAIVQFLQSAGLVPFGLEFTTMPDVAYSKNRHRVFVIPNYNYPDLVRIANDAGIGSSPTQTFKNFSETSTAKEDEVVDPQEQKIRSVFELERLARKKDVLIDFLKQNMIVVSIDPQTIPKNLDIMLKKVDVVIDSIDLSQATRGDLVPTTTKLGNDSARWDK
jgi:hypothetical protein